MAWWHKNNLRLIQTNLKEEDALLDVDQLIGDLRSFAANVLLFNAGGIRAFYPTELEYHMKSRFLQDDLLGKVVEKAHASGIRVIGRFDFSKANQSVYEKHPEWFYKSPRGEIVNYNGEIHTCVNGYWQKRYSLEILREALDNYELDGVFFNMFGYQTTDYSGNYYGICQCENCRSRFREMYGQTLPQEENPEDPVYRMYLEFQQATTSEILESIRELVKQKSPEIAISTYTDHCVDIFRKESNTAVDRPLPYWLYSAAENIKPVVNTWQDKIVSSSNVHFVDIPYRFTSISSHFARIRLYENLAHRSGLDFYVLGTLDQKDRENYAAIREIFQLHAANEEIFSGQESLAEIILIKPDQRQGKSAQKEYLGLFKILSEAHLQFDVIQEGFLELNRTKIMNYKVILLPGIANLVSPDFDVIKNAAASGEISVIATGGALTGGSKELDALGSEFGAIPEKRLSETRSAYLEIDDKQLFSDFPLTDLCFIDFDFWLMKAEAGTRTAGRFLFPARYGPPERVGGHEKSEYPGLAAKKKDGAVNVMIPWFAGRLYHVYGFETHKKFFLNVLANLVGFRSHLRTNAPGAVEIALNQVGGSNEMLLHLINTSGYNGTTFTEPIAIRDIEISLDCRMQVHGLVSITSGQQIEFSHEADKITFKIPQLNAYEAIHIS